MRWSYLSLALLCHVVLATAYAWRTPTFEGPDENSHYEYAWHIANAGKLPLTPALAQQRGLPQTEAAVLGHHPPLYYTLLAAGLVATGSDDTVFGPRVNGTFGTTNPGRHLFFQHEQHSSRVLFELRLISVLLGALTILCVHRLGRSCCPNAPRVADLAALLTACLPMWSFLHGVINNDVLATLLSSATLLALVELQSSDRVTMRHGIVIGTMLGLAWLSKLTTLFLGGLAGLVALAVLRKTARTGTMRPALPPIGVAVAVALVLSGWLFWRNDALYGDPLAMTAHDQSFQPIPKDLRWHYLFGLDPWPDWAPSFVPTVFTSLFGHFGWFSLPPPPALVWCGSAIAVTALLGLIRAAFDRNRCCMPRPLWLLVSAMALVFAGTLYFNLSAPQPQARLLFPAVAPAAVLIAAGLVRISENVPFRRHLVALLPITAGAVFWLWFLPAFDPALAPAPLEHRSLVGGIVDDATAPTIQWRGDLTMSQATMPPTLLWTDPSARPDTNYTLYAFDEDGRVWLATHEWTHGDARIAGTEFTMPPNIFEFLPRGQPLFFKLRRLPTTSDDDPATLPCSARLPFSRR